MTDYIETKTTDGATVRIEVESTTKSSAGFGSRAAAPTDVSTEGAAEIYEQTLTTIRACANGVIETLQNLEATPSAATIDFSIKVDAEAGVMIAKSRENGQFKISLSWKQVEEEDKEEK